MSQNTTVKFATFGPNRGLTLQIGNFQFVDGLCEVPANEAASAASILCRYHDVCYDHELEQKIAEYDTARENRAAASGTFPQKSGSEKAPKSESDPDPQAKPDEQQPSDDAANGATEKQAEAPEGEGKPEPEAKKAHGGGKKNSGKHQA